MTFTSRPICEAGKIVQPAAWAQLVVSPHAREVIMHDNGCDEAVATAELRRGDKSMVMVASGRIKGT
jgi:hypothetical protein